ncbi:tRNA (adenosine(37)-N6)-threonylcarbamoyltransferase complex ATPase subunit type 1 TsaE [Candidatus Wolfebacteria bacterium]|nr:tRNA (adenosine(37)-N6)-threonylcarbamoyltransferase complex ATPase subunit type 1 TsaE [Candidatus Wolfebacteria bacterium]
MVGVRRLADDGNRIFVGKSNRASIIYLRRRFSENRIAGGFIGYSSWRLLAKKDFYVANRVSRLYNKEMIYKTFSVGQTKKLAGFLAKKTARLRRVGKNALVFALTGELGAGKTAFAQGFLRAIGVKKKIASPTFVLFKRFKIKDLRFENIYHIDCYRIHKPKELLKLGLKEILNNSRNIVLIEWPERIKKILPKNSVWIKLEHAEKINERKITLKI